MKLRRLLHRSNSRLLLDHSNRRALTTINWRLLLLLLIVLVGRLGDRCLLARGLSWSLGLNVLHNLWMLLLLLLVAAGQAGQLGRFDAVALPEAAVAVARVAALAQTARLDAGKGVLHGLAKVGHAEGLEPVRLAVGSVLVVNLLLG